MSLLPRACTYRSVRQRELQRATYLTISIFFLISTFPRALTFYASNFRCSASAIIRLRALPVPLPTRDQHTPESLRRSVLSANCCIQQGIDYEDPAGFSSGRSICPVTSPISSKPRRNKKSAMYMHLPSPPPSTGSHNT